jgi:hypothetical protein
MKERQIISPKLNDAEKKALLKEVAAKLSTKEVLFPKKVERAKAYLKIAQFPSEQKSDA